MKSWRRGRGRWIAAAGVIAIAVGVHTGTAQQVQTPTLEGILKTLQDNLDTYHKDIPSFMCDEHAVVKKHPLLTTTPFTPHEDITVTDSTFRVKRTTNANGGTTLAEFRDIKTINGHAGQGEEISGTAILIGALSGRANAGLAGPDGLHALYAAIH